MSDHEAEFREFVGAQMESLRGLAYLTCGDWQTAEDAVLAALARLYVKWGRVENPGGYARTAVVRAAIDETRRPWWRREQSHSHAALRCPEGTVKVYTSRGLDTLRRVLGVTLSVDELTKARHEAV